MPQSDDESGRLSAAKAVGFRKPPGEHRFQEGKVSNPYGRRGKPKEKIPYLDQLLPHPLTIEGCTRRYTRLEALQHALFAQAMKGNVSAAQELDRICRTQANAPEDDWAPSPEGEQALNRFIKRHREGADKPVDDDGKSGRPKRQAGDVD